MKSNLIVYQVGPAPIAQINFSRPKRGTENNVTDNPNTPWKNISAVNKAEEKKFFDRLKTFHRHQPFSL